VRHDIGIIPQNLLHVM